MTVWSVTIYAIRENRSYSETGVKSSKTIFKGFFNIFLCTSTTALNKINDVRQPGVEPGSTAWKATMLTVTPPTLVHQKGFKTHPYIAYIASQNLGPFRWCVGPLYLVGRNSSVGRALDWRSKGPWFNPGFRHCRNTRRSTPFLILAILTCSDQKSQ